MAVSVVVCCFVAYLCCLQVYTSMYAAVKREVRDGAE